MGCLRQTRCKRSHSSILTSSCSIPSPACASRRSIPRSRLWRVIFPPVSLLPQRRVAIVIRPIIPGQNDDLATLAPILDAAQRGQGLLIARGFRDRSWQLLTNQDFMSTLAQESERRGLRVFQRTVCLVGAMHGTACRLHGNVIDEAGLAVSAAFGYDVSLQTDPASDSRSVTVSAGTERLSMGDAHFVQILTGAEIHCDNPVSSNQLVHAKGPEGIALDCSSSWFTYARTTPCQVACFYCETAYRSRVWGEVGCVPLALTPLLSSKLREVS